MVATTSVTTPVMDTCNVYAAPPCGCGSPVDEDETPVEDESTGGTVVVPVEEDGAGVTTTLPVEEEEDEPPVEEVTLGATVGAKVGINVGGARFVGALVVGTTMGEHTVPLATVPVAHGHVCPLHTADGDPRVNPVRIAARIDAKSVRGTPYHTNAFST